MTVPHDAFRRFQEELAAIDRKEHLPADVPVADQRLANARADFLSLRKRYGLTVADVVAFFPEEEGIAYLQQLIAASEAKPVRRRKSSASDCAFPPSALSGTFPRLGGTVPTRRRWSACGTAQLAPTAVSTMDGANQADEGAFPNETKPHHPRRTTWPKT
jgi:ribosomal protein L22